VWGSREVRGATPENILGNTYKEKGAFIPHDPTAIRKTKLKAVPSLTLEKKTYVGVTNWYAFNKQNSSDASAGGK